MGEIPEPLCKRICWNKCISLEYSTKNNSQHSKCWAVWTLGISMVSCLAKKHRWVEPALCMHGSWVNDFSFTLPTWHFFISVLTCFNMFWYSEINIQVYRIWRSKCHPGDSSRLQQSTSLTACRSRSRCLWSTRDLAASGMPKGHSWSFPCWCCQNLVSDNTKNSDPAPSGEKNPLLKSGFWPSQSRSSNRTMCSAWCHR